MRVTPRTKSACASISLLFKSITPGCLTYRFPFTERQFHAVIAGLQLEREPARRARRLLLPFASVHVDDLDHASPPIEELVPSGPLTMPLIVPLGLAGLGAVWMTGTPCQQAAAISRHHIVPMWAERRRGEFAGPCPALSSPRAYSGR